MNELALRKQYYDKVGFSATSGKNVLKDLLKEQPINLEKLTSFALKNILPSAYRPLVWKLLLGITPRYVDSQEFVCQQYTLLFNDLFEALKTIDLESCFKDELSSCNPSHSLQRSKACLILHRRSEWNGNLQVLEPRHFLLMWLISEGKLPQNLSERTHRYQKFLAIAQRMITMFEDPIDIYHVCSAIWKMLYEKEEELGRVVNRGIEFVKKQSGDLYDHLLEIGFFDQKILEELCHSLFCEIFPEAVLEKLYDKIFTGNFSIISYVIRTLLQQFQLSLKLATTAAESRAIIFNLRIEEANLISKSSIELWHKEALSDLE